MLKEDTLSYFISKELNEVTCNILKSQVCVFDRKPELVGFEPSLALMEARANS